MIAGGWMPWRRLLPVWLPLVLLALAGLVSIHNDTWTTDRARAVERWSEIEPARADRLMSLLGWVDDRPDVDAATVAATLDDTIEPIVQRFNDEIGPWT